MSTVDGIAVEWADGVAWFRVTRPERRNAIDMAAALRLTGLLRRADQDHRVRCVVVTGSANDFCTGGDLAPAPPDALDEKDVWDTGSVESGEDQTLLDYRWPLVPFQGLFRTLWELETPVVSAVNGTVAGIGWMLALLADLVVAAEGARWTHAFVRRGMMPHAGDTVFLPRVIPFHRLNELSLLSDPVTSDVLHQWGLIYRLVPRPEVDQVAGEVAGRLASGPTLSLGQTKRSYRRSLLGDVEGALAEERATTALVSATADRQEGTDAFLEGRRPSFIGR